MKIYIDILIVTNCILTMIYLQTFSKITHRKIKNRRFFVASLAGGLFSVIIIANGNSYFSAVIITLIKFFGVILTLALSIKFNGFWDFFRSLLIYSAIRIGYTGVILVYWQISDSKKIYVRNYTTYFDISLPKMIFAVITAYILLSIYEFILRQFHSKSASYTAVYRNGNYCVSLPAVADSGNKLCDSFTGMPIVIFCCDDMFYHFQLDNPQADKNSGFRLIPFNTINGNGLIAVTPKGTVTLIDDKEKNTDIKCYVGIIKSEKGKSRAIFNPAVLN